MPSISYKKAGVDIDKADMFIEGIKPLLRSTRRPEVLGHLGGFSGLFKPRLGRMKAPVLVSSTDGVGTKLLIADLLGRHDTIGIDLVAMCVNDVVVTGAEPLFFLDYIAVGRLDPRRLHEVMKGVTEGCRQAGCALIGGETAELPGMYAGGKMDLAGFSVGLVDQPKIIDGRACRPGDVLVGLASSGLHSNGFSLVRKVFNPEELGGKIGREVITPTRIYVAPLLKLIKRYKVKAMAHITGGGLLDNLPRVLPKGLGAAVRKNSWPIPAVFRTIRDRGGVAEREMFRTFNMGIGMVLAVAPRSADRVIAFLREMGIEAWEIGVLGSGGGGVRLEGD
jgi:phosphoribosylformylglycinamidine cyclo-ligase